VRTHSQSAIHSKNKGLLPGELAKKIAPWTVNIAEMAGVVGKIILTGVVAFLMCGGAGPFSDRNGFVCVLSPWVCPLVIVLLWSTLVSRLQIRLHRGNPFAENSRINTRDPSVMRLEELFNSEEARRHLWRATLKLSCILFAIVGTVAILARHSLRWTIPSPQNQFLLHTRGGEPGGMFWAGWFGGFLFTAQILITDYYRWCLLTWARRESSSDATQD
jgi:hypothetical protein